MCFLLNHTHYDEINGIPITNSIGYTSYISPLLHFRFCQPVYYKVYYSDLTSHSTEKMVDGLVSPNMLDMLWPSRYLMMIPKISSFVLTCVLIRNPWNPIFALTLFVGGRIPFSNRVQTEIRKLCHILMILQKRMNKFKKSCWWNLPKDVTSGKTGYTNKPKMNFLNTYDIIGRRFLMASQEYGQKFRVPIVKMIDNH